MTGPGDEIAAGAGGSLPECHAEHEHRDQVIRTLKAAVVQGRLTEENTIRGRPERPPRAPMPSWPRSPPTSR